MTTSYDYDLIVLGAGPAGEKGAAQAAFYGKRVATVEMGKEPGGAAVHTGTLPSKTLRETALYLSGYRQSELYGLDVHVNPDLAVPKMLSRNDVVRGLEVERIRWNLDRHRIQLYHGFARFLDPHTIEITSKEAPPVHLTSHFFLIATGSEPYHPPFIPFDDRDVHDSDSILLLDRLPKTLMILGGGVIGCEYASMFAALHVDVTLIEPRPHLLSFLDLEMGERLRGALVSLGINLRMGKSAVKVERKEAGPVELTLASGETLEAEKLLGSLGRSGRTKELGLSAIGVETDSRSYIKVNEDFQTAIPTIYAAGDVIGFPSLASASMEQARVAICHAFGFTYKRQVSSLIPYGIYTIPEVSCIGISEQEAQKKNIPYVVGRAFYQDNARGKIIGDKEGMIKLLFHKESRKLIGCHCIGDRASELVHIGQTVIILGGSINTFIDMVFNYPTLSELFKYAAYDALSEFAKLEDAKNMLSNPYAAPFPNT
ncbi:Si-specific NAD(P)(+) transhydrogenase [Pajaroellobacter abortibovis]|uniref:Soluble pyridine nucleotide transhydrogenase n=1 Tax=Pajaroellobacter abortibovis TaxID=1882918 RepID=A0A1L6MYC1_9BACT|nr:Si-specific NAD(P)(+) transhydrogenase [Pajaroellobacter abortibovis]APS00486.1 NAD(P)(+) transhydrogenase [Pajaroellobacter abortibovis]